MSIEAVLYIIALSFMTALIVEWFFYYKKSVSYADATLHTKSRKEVGRDFERKVADRMESLGWRTTITPETGDQGVDIIAKNHSVTLAVQCKCQRNPVGNRAVSEVCTGKIHYAADHAIVISESSFTKKAKELAETTSVFLLSFEEIQNINEIFGASSSSMESSRSARFIVHTVECLRRVAVLMGAAFIIIVAAKYYINSGYNRNPFNALLGELIDPQPTQPKNIIIDGHTTKMRVVAPNEVNIRKSPGASFDIIGKVRNGDYVDVYRISHDGWASTPQGWIRSRYLEKIE